MNISQLFCQFLFHKDYIYADGHIKILLKACLFLQPVNAVRSAAEKAAARRAAAHQVAQRRLEAAEDTNVLLAGIARTKIELV